MTLGHIISILNCTYRIRLIGPLYFIITILFSGMPGGVYWGTEKVSHKLPNNTDLQFWRHWQWNSKNDKQGP